MNFRFFFPKELSQGLQGLEKNGHKGWEMINFSPDLHHFTPPLPGVSGGTRFGMPTDLEDTIESCNQKT